MIVNPKTGVHRHKLNLRLSEIVKKLKPGSCNVDLFITQKRGDAFTEVLAKSSHSYDVIIAAGGDGTVNEVVNGIMRITFTPVPVLGIIPLGTANLLADELGISENPLEACEIILRGNIKEIDLGKTGTHYLSWL